MRKEIDSIDLQKLLDSDSSAMLLADPEGEEKLVVRHLFNYYLPNGNFVDARYGQQVVSAHFGRQGTEILQDEPYFEDNREEGAHQMVGFYAIVGVMSKG